MVSGGGARKTGGMTSAGDARNSLGRILAPWRIAYGAESRRRLAWSVVAVPRALAALPAALRRPDRLRSLARALFALPVALAGSALTGTLAFLVLINVLAYPFRPWLGLAESTGNTEWYAGAWGGPTLGGAWATHAALILLLVLPVLAWAIRGLTALQWRLTGAASSTTGTPGIPSVDRTAPRVPAATPVPVAPASLAPAPPAPARVATAPDDARASRPSGGHLRRTGAVLAALALLVASSLIAHANGIGDNLLWAPRDAASGLALAVTLAPVAGLLLLGRTAWWQPARMRH
jgi:hypothetical protein